VLLNTASESASPIASLDSPLELGALPRPLDKPAGKTVADRNRRLIDNPPDASALTTSARPPKKLADAGTSISSSWRTWHGYSTAYCLWLNVMEIPQGTLSESDLKMGS